MARAYPPRAPEGSRCPRCGGTGRVYRPRNFAPDFYGDSTDDCWECGGGGWACAALEAECMGLADGLMRERALTAGAGD